VPDLNRSAVLNWLKLQEPDKPDLVADPVTRAEGHPDVETALVRLGQALDVAAMEDPAKLAARLSTGPVRDDLRTLLGQLGTPRTLCLLDWIIDAGLPETDAILGAVLAPDETGTGQFLQATLSLAARSPLLERLYGPDRLAALLAACQPVTHLREAA
jgi:hypothetical protein